MQEKIRVYCDTNIYLDFLLGRKDYLRPLDEFAHSLFRKVTAGEYILVVSDHLIFELEKHIEEEKINNFLEPFIQQGKIVYVTKTEDDIKKAKILSTTNWRDMLHAILAHKASTEYLVTRNVYDFAGTEHLLKTVFPEQIG